MTADLESGRLTLDKSIGARIRMLRKMRSMSQHADTGAYGFIQGEASTFEVSGHLAVASL